MTADKVLEKMVGMPLVEFFVKSLPANKPICLFGFGADGRQIYSVMQAKGIKVSCICDNGVEEVSAKTNMKIVSPENAVAMYPDAFFVIGSSKYCYEMALQLVKLGIGYEQLIMYDLMVICDYHAEFVKKGGNKLEYLAAKYYDITGIRANLNMPTTFNEKMMVAMVDDSDEYCLWRSRLTDKYLVRKWVAEKIGEEYLIPLLGVWNHPDEIDFAQLPSKYVLKTTHGCGWNIVVDNKTVVDYDLIRIKLSRWLKIDFADVNFEEHYRYIVPSLICEEYIENSDGDIQDYKVFCFNGEPKYIMYLCNRKKGLRMAFYDLHWHRMPFVYTYPQYKGEVPKPYNLDKLLAISRSLCRGFKNVRIDWYILNDGSIKFGEMTFTSCAGMAKWEPKLWDNILGDLV